MIDKWIDKPTRRGEYWQSPFLEGEYRYPRIISVIDYERPGRGLEVLESIDRYSIPVGEYCAEWYPKAKYMLIEFPDIKVLNDLASKLEEKVESEQERIKRIAENMKDYWKHQACGAEGGW